MRRTRTGLLLLAGGALLAAGCGSAAHAPPAAPGSPAAAGYWRASGTATALLAWEKAHITGGFSVQDVIIGPPSWNTVYSLPAVPGVLSIRELNVQVYDTGGGSVVIMADAMVAWEPPRPASEVIPAGVTEVTITPLGTWPGHPAPVTVTAASVVRRLAALVNGLPLSNAGDGPCASDPNGLSLTFRAAAGGPDVVGTSPAACGALNLRLGGKDEPALMPPASFQATVLRTAGLGWQPTG